MRRRDVVFGLGCVAALAGAETLRPRRLLSLAGGRKITTMVPTTFAGWAAEGGGDIVLPKVPGSLADTLYNETVARTYRNTDGGAPIMLLIAHGDSQSDLLQLHRPEVCYQAVGFAITEHRFDPVALAPGVTVPSVELTARAGGRVEDMLYWTRLGEYLPTTAGEQRRDRLAAAMDGYVADGVLVRVSMVREGEEPDWARLNGFVAAMMKATPNNGRVALVGTERAKALAGATRTV
jgi:EpsI family protein